MIRLIYGFLFICVLFQQAYGNSQDTNAIALHFQIYDNGICMDMHPSIYYGSSRFQKSKAVLQSGAYYSRTYAYVNSTDSAHLNPQTNHQLQSSSLQFNPELEYELVIIHSLGYLGTKQDSMVITISKLDSDAQLIIPFKKGRFKLHKMEHFTELKQGAAPDFILAGSMEIKKTLKLDSTAQFANRKTKAKYYKVADNFPLYFVQEFDSIHPNNYSQGYRLMQGNGSLYPAPFSVWRNSDPTKYGYWEYFENDKRIRHELCASILLEKYECYPSGQLKFAAQYGQSNKETKHIHYLEDGKIKEEFHHQTSTRNSTIKVYEYSTKGNLILISTYKSLNGITKQEIQQRELFYPSGQLKMEENFVSTYTIKYYNEDGTKSSK
jgi:hypothetical protein